ncbi:MAG: metallophosphoesterase [Thermoflavifilum sp.]|nr:metallophosphoesterase [Thermoflavifilum sp.]MCL6515119.1 metallophosphoesterase [Alicyclobacillus sp.]
MFRFVHAADLHLDSPLRGLAERVDGNVEVLRGAARRALERLVDLCVAEQVDFLVLAGDIYDGDWPDYQTGLFFVRQMARLDQAGIPVFLIRGNHDAASQITRQLTLPRNVIEFPVDRPKTVVLEQTGVAVHGQSFEVRDVRTNLAAAYPAPVAGLFNIGILHTGLEGAEGHERYAPCRVQDLMAKGYDYWALGHVHQRQVVHERPWIVYPGNIQGRHVRETGDKGCYLVTVEAGAVHLAYHSLDVVRWRVVEVDLSGAQEPEDVGVQIRAAAVRQVAEDGGMPLALRLVLTGATPLHAHLLDDAARWRAEAIAALESVPGQIWLEKLVVQTTPPVSIVDQEARSHAWRVLEESLTAALQDDIFLEGCLNEITRTQQKSLSAYLNRPDALRVQTVEDVRALAREAQQLLESWLRGEVAGS